MCRDLALDSRDGATGNRLGLGTQTGAVIHFLVGQPDSNAFRENWLHERIAEQNRQGGSARKKEVEKKMKAKMQHKKGEARKDGEKEKKKSFITEIMMMLMMSSIIRLEIRCGAK